MNGLCPRKRRSWLGPTHYNPRCKCGKPLEPINGKQRHVGACEACQEKFLLLLRLVNQ